MPDSYQLPISYLIRSLPNDSSLWPPIETQATAENLSSGPVSGVVSDAHDAVDAALSPSIFAWEGQIAQLADSKLRDLEPQMIFDELRNPERFTGRWFEDTIASYFRFTDREVSAMQRQYPQLSRFDVDARRQLACECLFRHNNKTLPRQIITTYLYAFAAKKLRDYQQYIPISWTAHDLATDEFDWEIEKITLLLRGHDIILKELNPEFKKIRTYYSWALKKKSQPNSSMEW
jgi:hypothetical protein